MKTNKTWWLCFTEFFLEWEMFRTKLVQKIKTHILCSVTLKKTCPVCEIILKHVVEPGRSQVTMWRVLFACWIPEATNTHSEQLRLIAVALSRLYVTLYIHCLSLLRYLNRLLQHFFYHGVTATVIQWFIITLRRTTLGIAPQEEWSAQRGGLYLTTHNTHKRQTSMPPGGNGTHNPSKRAAGDPRLIDRVATGTGIAAV
jgi:hypothetical protein